MKLTKTLSSAAVGTLAVALGLSLQYAFADWSSAPGNPPSNNTAAPINISSSNQAKTGGLTLGSSISSTSIPLDVEGIGYLQAIILGKNSGPTFQYLDGNQGSGKVLTSDVNGNASWQKASSLGIHFINPVILANNISTSGTTTVSLQSAGVPSTASAVILEANGFDNESDKGGSTQGGKAPYVAVETSSSGPYYYVLAQQAGSTNLRASDQGIYPIITSNGQASLQYYASTGWNDYTLTVVGYIGSN